MWGITSTYMHNIIHKAVHEHRGYSPRVQILGLEMLPLIGGLCCVGFMNPIGVVDGVWIQILTLSTGRNLVGSTWTRGQNSFRNVVF
jgi:hypothetical protein